MNDERGDDRGWYVIRQSDGGVLAGPYETTRKAFGELPEGGVGPKREFYPVRSLTADEARERAV